MFHDKKKECIVEYIAIKQKDIGNNYKPGVKRANTHCDFDSTMRY